MQLKRDLPLRDLGVQRLTSGFVAGAAFAATLYLAGVSVAGPFLDAQLNRPRVEVANAQDSNVHARALGWPERPVPTIVGRAEAAAPAWFGPFWAGLAAAFGQALVLSVWFDRPTAPTVHARRTRLRVLGALATGRMWIWLALLVFVELWFDYAVLIYGGNIWASAFGLPQDPDPFVPFAPLGAFSLLLIGLLALEPWRGLQLAFRCRWWPVAGVAVTAVFGAVLYVLGRWAGAGTA